MVSAIALPDELQPLAGRIVDVDSHEMMPAQMWEDVFGPEARELAEAVIHHSPTWEVDNNSHNVPDFAGDVLEIDRGIADIKGPKAPGAVDLGRREAVMDAMGVSRQLMYPTGWGGWTLTMMTQTRFDPKVLSSITGDRDAKARKWFRAYNDWFLQTAHLSDRIRPVPLLMGDTVAELMESGREMIRAGIRAIMLPPAIPPGGVSPAHPDLDPFWTMMTEADCVVTIHLGSEGSFFDKHTVWRDAPVFTEGYRNVGEFSMDPWYTATAHIPAQNFVQCMVLGGVFVRHPELRLGVIEIGAHWVGPMNLTMDLWYQQLARHTVLGERLPELPSEYVKRNVRVSVYPWEPLARYVNEFGLEDVICFASDYPHLEGGRDMIAKMADQIVPCGPEVTEKFFVTNGEFLFPK